MAILLHATALVVVLVPSPPGLRIALPIVLLLVSYLMLWTLYGTRYRLTDFELRIACGPFRWRIPYDDIERISPTRSPVSGPACSLDRLEVVAPDASTLGLMISPERKLEFLRELVALAPSLRLRDDRVVRAEPA